MIPKIDIGRYMDKTGSESNTYMILSFVHTGKGIDQVLAKNSAREIVQEE